MRMAGLGMLSDLTGKVRLMIPFALRDLEFILPDGKVYRQFKSYIVAS
jgi:hypothetical protein